MKKFNPKETHGQVYGSSVQLVEQNGILYTLAGVPVTLSQDGSITRIVEPDEPETESRGEYRSMSVAKLKEVCRVYDIEFTTKDEVVALLEGAA